MLLRKLSECCFLADVYIYIFIYIYPVYCEWDDLVMLDH